MTAIDVGGRTCEIHSHPNHEGVLVDAPGLLPVRVDSISTARTMLRNVYAALPGIDFGDPYEEAEPGEPDSADPDEDVDE